MARRFSSAFATATRDDFLTCFTCATSATRARYVIGYGGRSVFGGFAGDQAIRFSHCGLGIGGAWMARSSPEWVVEWGNLRLASLNGRKMIEAPALISGAAGFGPASGG